MKKRTVVKCFLVVSILLGLIFVVLSIGWVPFLNSKVTSGAKISAALTQENEPTWKDIPGPHDINIQHDNYLFSCINMEDVIYKGETPIFEQYGPYIYRETDNWTNVTYDEDLEVTGVEDENFKNNLDGLKKSKGLTANYKQSAQYWIEGEDKMDHFKQGRDTPLNITNQAAMSVWYGQLN